METMKSSKGFLVTFILTFVLTVVCEEDWNWDTPCIYYQPGQCTQQLDSGEIVSCEIISEGADCDSLEEYVHWSKIPDKPTNLTAILDLANGTNLATNASEEHLMVRIGWKQDIVFNRGALTGFHVSMRGFTSNGEYDYHYYNQERCFTFNLTANDFEDLNARYLEFTFDCFRPLSPYSEYQIVVRTMPTNNEAGEDIDAYYTTESYRFLTPSCGDPRISHTTECQIPPGEEPAYWRPQYLLGYSPDYHQLAVKFDLPPHSYGFDKYDITVNYYDPQSDRCSGYAGYFEDISPNDDNVVLYNVTRDGRTFTVMDYLTPYYEYEPELYCIKVKPVPTDDTCGMPCITTIYEGVVVLGNNNDNHQSLGQYEVKMKVQNTVKIMKRKYKKWKRGNLNDSL